MGWVSRLPKKAVAYESFSNDRRSWGRRLTGVYRRGHPVQLSFLLLSIPIETSEEDVSTDRRRRRLYFMHLPDFHYT